MEPEAIEVDELARWIEGEVGPLRAAEIEAKVASCTISKARADALLETIEDLRRPDPRVANIDLFPEHERLIADVLRSSQRRNSWFARAALFGLAAAVGSALIFLRPSDDRLVARGGPKAASASTSVQVYHQRVDGVVTPISGSMARDDGLLFSYSRLEHSDLGYLMIFGVDSQGGVHWYYPAGSSEDSSSIEVRHGARVELPDVVREELPPGPLAIYGLFTRAPWRASEVTLAIAAQQVRGGGKAPVLDGASQHRIDVEVLP